jgi:5-methylcytosine-specific restriction endonuclease McrA
MSVIGKRGGECAYCHRTFRRLTKEHVVPHCVGGTLTIKVCPGCNNRRQTSLVDPLFVAWRNAHPDLFQQAVDASTDPTQTLRWLQSGH